MHIQRRISLHTEGRISLDPKLIPVDLCRSLLHTKAKLDTYLQVSLNFEVMTSTPFN
jgi:hypothetical protein